MNGRSGHSVTIRGVVHLNIVSIHIKGFVVNSLQIIGEKARAKGSKGLLLDLFPNLNALLYYS